MAAPVGQHPLSRKHFQLTLADVSTASIAYFRFPEGGRIVRFQSTLQAAITVAAAAITTELNGVAITGGAWTVLHTSSAPGDLDQAIPTAGNMVVEGDLLEVISDGGSTTAAALVIDVELETAP